MKSKSIRFYADVDEHYSFTPHTDQLCWQKHVFKIKFCLTFQRTALPPARVASAAASSLRFGLSNEMS
jgi:hypothetical protein